MQLELMKQTLLQTDLFQDISNIEPSCLFSRRYQKGQQVARYVNQQQCIGVLASGAVDIYSIACDGSEINFNTIKRGEVFGVCSIFLEDQIEAFLKCRQNTTVVYLPKPAFLNMLHQSPVLLERYGILCSKKIQFMVKRIEFLSIQSCRMKLVQYLFSNQKPQGTVTLPCTKEQLAKRLGVSRSALFREIAYFQKKELITVKGSCIEMKDKEGLTQALYQNDKSCMVNFIK